MQLEAQQAYYACIEQKKCPTLKVLQLKCTEFDSRLLDTYSFFPMCNNQFSLMLEQDWKGCS